MNVSFDSRPLSGRNKKNIFQIKQTVNKIPYWSSLFYSITNNLKYNTSIFGVVNELSRPMNYKYKILMLNLSYFLQKSNIKDDQLAKMIN